MSSKGKKIGAIAVDVFLFLFLAAIVLAYLMCTTDVIDGVNKGWFGAVDMVYGFEAYLYNFLWAALIMTVIVPVVPVAAIYDIVILIVKLKRKTIKTYEIIAIASTLGLILIGFGFVLYPLMLTLDVVVR